MQMINNKMNIVYKKVEELIPYVNNPRNNKDAIDKVASSIKNFGFKVPLVIDSKNEIITGHTRLLASKKLGIEEVPVIIADDLNEAQVKAFRIADNKVSEYAEWDEDLLKIELEELVDLDFDILDTGFEATDFKDLNIDGFGDLLSPDGNNIDETYTKEINIPQYEMTGEKPSLDELVNDTKTKELIKEIIASNITEEEKDFLIKSAQRHLAFSYQKVAEYYAHSSKEMQELMEKSALVIIDFEDAIKNGYVKLSEAIKDMITEE